MRLSNRKTVISQLDWGLVSLYLILVLLGWISIYATTFQMEADSLLNLTTNYGKQLFFIILSVVLIIIVLSFEAGFYERFASIFYILSILSLVGLFIFGKTINGQTAWYTIGTFTLQPSEFVKLTTALAVSKIMSDKMFDIKKFTDFKNVLIVLVIPFVLILLQPDFGSALIYFAFIFVFLREGFPVRIFYALLGLSLIFISTIKIGVGYTFLLSFILLFGFYYFATRREPLFVRKYWYVMILSFVFFAGIIAGSDIFHKKVLKQHHRDRLGLWLRMENNPEKTRELKQSFGFNNDQSIKTIASGGFTGKGFLEGDRTNGKFVPEQHTDYIFSTIGEEFGFWGSTLVIVLFMLLILRILQKAEQQKSDFSRIFGYSVASIFFIHFVINIGMVLDLLPTVGIPLPFFSYGGSSLWGFTLLLFIFIRLDANKANEL